MVRSRVFGSDVPFLGWCREKGRTGELPSSSIDRGVVISDVDCTVHQYKSPVDRIGTRELQAILEVEVKTRSGEPTDSQVDTYRKKHVSIKQKVEWKKQTIFNYGVAFVSMSGTTPDDSDVIRWGRFSDDEHMSICWREIDKHMLLSLLRFDLHPDSFAKNPFRRHHGLSSTFIQRIKTPLGFDVEESVVIRS